MHTQKKNMLNRLFRNPTIKILLCLNPLIMSTQVLKQPMGTQVKLKNLSRGLPFHH